MALKSHDWRLLFSRADIFSFELLVQPQRKRKTKGLSECRQAGETTGGPRQVCFDFLYGRKRLSRRVTDGIVVCRREKKIL